jgi:hypothetical protein
MRWTSSVWVSFFFLVERWCFLGWGRVVGLCVGIFFYCVSMML